MKLLTAARAIARRPPPPVASALRPRHLHLHHAAPFSLAPRQPPPPNPRPGLGIRTYALAHARPAPVTSLADVGAVLKDADWMLLRLEPPLAGGMLMYRVTDLAACPQYALEQAYVALGQLAGSLARGARTWSKHEWRDSLGSTSQAFKEALQKQEAELAEFGDEHAKYTERLAAAKVLKLRVESAKRWLETERGSQTRREQSAGQERRLMESRMDALEKKIEEGEKEIRLARAQEVGHTTFAAISRFMPIPFVGELTAAAAAGFQAEITALKVKRDIFRAELTKNHDADDAQAHKEHLAARTLSDIARFAASLADKVARLEAGSVTGQAELEEILKAKAAVARILDRHLADMSAAALTASAHDERDTARAILQILLLTPEKPAKLWIQAEKVCETMGRVSEDVLGGAGGGGDFEYGDEGVGELLGKVRVLVAGRVATDEVKRWKQMESGWGRRAFRRRS